jgi:outer membrane protein
MFTIKSISAPAIIAATLALGMGQANAAAGDMFLRFGLANIDPDSSSRGVVADDAVAVEDDTAAYITYSYMYTDNIGVEVLASTPFTHDITLNGSKIAEGELLPPTVSLQYHFSPGQNVRPYVGAGINWTIFLDDKATNTITSIDLDDSVGLAVQVGVDVDINKEWFFNASLRKISIDTTAKTNLGDIEVDIDPTVLSLGVGFRF